MKPFHTIAIPHQDILEGKLRMEEFAADLWETFQNRASSEYSDPQLFFQRTYMTEGLKNLIDRVEKRVKGKGGDATLQLQTPFGGGKTHSLIALLHKAREWKVNVSVVVGTNLDAQSDTIWALIEKQLTGKVTLLKNQTAPGKEKLKQVLEPHQPLLILMDELLEYVTKASGVKVLNSNLAEQTIAFMQELSEVMGIMPNSCLVVTLPSSYFEHYGETAEKFYNQLKKVVGRVEKILTPVEDYEIAKVIRQRLFNSIDEKELTKIVNEFISYCEKENILPSKNEKIQYRDSFFDAYPFLPEVIDCLYKRWGSFHSFQRTRGVLRILAQVVYSLRDKNIPYISLADFDLSNQNLRQELIKHIGNEYNSIIAQDISGNNSGSKRIDNNLGSSYQGLQLATRAATTIFMYSFSGGPEKGITLTEIKRLATTLGNPSSVISEAVEQLKSKLFYFQFKDDKYFFSNKPNITKIIIDRMENIKEEEILDKEKELLKSTCSQQKLQTYIWIENSNDIIDNELLKLVILKEDRKELIEDINKNKGLIPRVNINTIFYLVPKEDEKVNFQTQIRRYLALKSIENDTTLNLSPEDLKYIKEERKKSEAELKELLFRYYRYIYLANHSGFKRLDIGIPTHGETRNLDHKVFEFLKDSNEIIEKLSPIIIQTKYLGDKDTISTSQLVTLFYRTPGEPRPTSKEVIIESIKNGVKDGLFGIGVLNSENKITNLVYKTPVVNISLVDQEVIVNEKLSKQLIKNEEQPPKDIDKQPIDNQNVTEIISEPVTTTVNEVSSIEAPPKVESINKLHLSFYLPKGKFSNLFQTINYITLRFEKVKITIEATDGEISKQEYEMRIKEGLRQLGIDVD